MFPLEKFFYRRKVQAMNVRLATLPTALLWLLILFPLVSASAVAQDQAGSRGVSLASPGSRTLTINQIETSKFPKVDIFASVTESHNPVSGLGNADFKVREDEVP